MSSFADFVTDFHDHFSRDPNACVAKGVDRRLDQLPDPSLAEAAHVVAEGRDLLQRIERVDRRGLDFDDRLDLDLARLALEREVHDRTYELDGKPRLARQPTAGDEIGDGIFLLFASDPRPAGERLADITGRLEAVPAYVDALLRRLDEPVARWAAMDLDKVAGLPDLFATLADWADEEAWADRRRLVSARSAAEEALRRYTDRLRALPTSTGIHLGVDAARLIVKLRGIDKTLEELHAMARDFLAETAETLERLRRGLVAKYGLMGDTPTAELHRFLNERFAVDVPDGDLDAIPARYQREREKILAFIRERDLFPVFEDQDLRIMRTPPFMTPSIPAGAMMPPPPFRAGTKTSLVYLTLAEDLLDEHTELGIPSMMIHEGIPGHHLQLATAARHPSVIRRHFDAMEHAEGWTTMLEDYMLDVGYMGEYAEEARFIGKRDLSRIGARVAIDLFLMSGDKRFLDVGVACDLAPEDPFEAAGKLLAEVTGFSPPRVETELNWYSQDRGYPLSYLTGNRLVWQLKADVADAAAKRGDGADERDLDRAFHRLYLESGNMPVAFLRRVFEHAGML